MPSTHEDSTVDQIVRGYGMDDAVRPQLVDPACTENSDPVLRNPYRSPSYRGHSGKRSAYFSGTLHTPQEVFGGSDDNIHSSSHHSTGKSKLVDRGDGGFQSSTDSGPFDGIHQGRKDEVLGYGHARKNAFYELPTMWRDSTNFNRVRVPVRDEATSDDHPTTRKRVSSTLGYYANSPESYRPGQQLSSNGNPDDAGDWETIADPTVLRNSDLSFDPDISGPHYKQTGSSVADNSDVGDIGSLSTELSRDERFGGNMLPNVEPYLKHPPDSNHIHGEYRTLIQDGRPILVPSTSRRLVNNFPNANSRRSMLRHHPAPLVHGNNPFSSTPPETLSSPPPLAGLQARPPSRVHRAIVKGLSSVHLTSSSEISSSQHNSASAKDPRTPRRINKYDPITGGIPRPSNYHQLRDSTPIQPADNYHDIPLGIAGPSDHHQLITGALFNPNNSYEHILREAKRANRINDYGLPVIASDQDYKTHEAAPGFVETPTSGGRFQRKPHYFNKTVGHSRDEEMQNLGLQRQLDPYNNSSPVSRRAHPISGGEGNSRARPVSQLYNSSGLFDDDADADADGSIISSNMSPGNRAIYRALQRGKDVIFQPPLRGPAHPHRPIPEDANFPTNEMEILYNAEQLAQFREEASQARANDPNATGRTIALNVHAHLYGASRQILTDESSLRLQKCYGIFTLVLIFVSLMWPFYWFFTSGKLDLIMNWLSHGTVQNYSRYHKEVAWWLAMVSSILIAIGGPAAVAVAIFYATR